MHEHSSASPRPPAAEHPHPTSVFLSWSGPDSGRISVAFGTLLSAVHGRRVDPFHSAGMIGADPWRVQIGKAVARSHVAVLCLAPTSLGSTWLMYEAGAFFVTGDTYLLACGITAAELKGTPLDAYQVEDARDKDTVRRLVGLLVNAGHGDARASATGATEPAVDAAFENAWPAFSQVVDTIHREQEAKRRRSRIARSSILPLTIALLVLAALSWWRWTDIQCGVVDDQRCADLRWSQFVDQSKTKGNRDLDKKVSRRPFAVLAIGGSCQKGSLIPSARLVNAKSQHPSRPVVVFARSSYDEKDLAEAVVLGSTASPHTLVATGCRALPNGQIVHVLHFGTLSDNQLCVKVRDLEGFFDSRWRLAGDLADFLVSLDVPKQHVSQGDLNFWLQQCGVPPAPRRQAAVAETVVR
jgi:hypothetical protein